MLSQAADANRVQLVSPNNGTGARHFIFFVEVRG
jgi:hypothetical protein